MLTAAVVLLALAAIVFGVLFVLGGMAADLTTRDRPRSLEPARPGPAILNPLTPPRTKRHLSS